MTEDQTPAHQWADEAGHTPLEQESAPVVGTSEGAGATSENSVGGTPGLVNNATNKRKDTTPPERQKPLKFEKTDPKNTDT